MNDGSVPIPVLRVDGLTVAYGARTAVDSLTFQIEPGEIFGLLGPNGAGKSTALSAIEGLVPPRLGQISVDGFDPKTQPQQVRSLLGVQLQSSAFQPQLTIEQIVRLYAGLYGVRMSKPQIVKGLRDIGLDGERGKRFAHLSGGQQQRLALFIAVIHQPTLLLLDEPTSGLDPQSRRALWETIDRLRASGGSIVLTTHSLEEAQSVCDRLAIIDHGRLVATGTPHGLLAKYRTDPRVRKLARGPVTLEDVFIALTGSDIRD